ncbi:MAG TPA: hypothetical protein VI818_04825, partial [Candidatus Thermoplasmatota archaeon]|nr:hypothetical protein [Candidatus Thermoplasmatota archaeon]
FVMPSGHMSRWTCGAILLLLAMIAAPAAASQPTSAQDCHVPGQASTGLWELEADHDAGQFRSALRSREDPTRTFAASFRLDGARLVVAVSNGTGLNASRATTTVETRGLHEFRDRDGDGRFGPGDESRRRYDLGAVAGATLQVLGRVDGGYDAVAIYPVNASARSDLPVGKAPPLPGQLRLSFVVLEAAALVEGQWIPPTRVVLNAAVLNFPFVENDTRLAIEIRIEGMPASVRIADGFAARHGHATSDYQWAPCAALEGSPFPNQLLVVDDGGPGEGAGATALFGYPASDEVRQEFAASGAWSAPASLTPPLPLAPILGDLALFLSAALGSVLLVAATSWRRFRGP